MVTHSSIWSSDWVTQGKHDTEQYITPSLKTLHVFEMDDHEMILEKVWLPYQLYILRQAYLGFFKSFHL